MGIKKANSDIVAVKIGSTDLSAIYHGSDLVWSGVFEGLKGICTYSQDWTTDTGVHCKIVSSNDDGTYNFEAKCKGNDFNSLLYADTNIIKITSLEAKNAHLYRTFQNCTNITEIDFGENCQTEFSTLFEFANKCSNLQYVRNMGKLKPGSNISDCRNFFNGCKKLKTVDFGGLDLTTNNVADYIFADCNELETVGDISKLVGLGITSNARAIFKNCYKLDGINEYVKQWRVDNVKQIYSLFDGCYALTGELDLSGWNTSNFVSAYAMFKGCSSLTSINISGWDLRKVTDLSNMFNGCQKITSLQVTNTAAQNIVRADSMFQDCKIITIIDVTSFDLSHAISTHSMFSGCLKLINLGEENEIITFDLSNCEDATNMFNECYSLKSKIKIKGGSKLKSTSHMFSNCRNLEMLDLSEFDTSNCENMSGMFRTASDVLKENYYTDEYRLKHSYAVESIKVTDKCTNIYYMLPILWVDDGCLDLSTWDTTNVTNMTGFASAEVNVIFGEGFFNTSIDTIPLDCLNWLNDRNGQWLTQMFNILRDHPKTKDDNWEGQTIKFSYHTWYNVIFEGGEGNYTTAALRLQNAMAEAEDVGWMFIHI